MAVDCFTCPQRTADLGLITEQIWPTNLRNAVLEVERNIIQVETVGLMVVNIEVTLVLFSSALGIFHSKLLYHQLQCRWCNCHRERLQIRPENNSQSF